LQESYLNSSETFYEKKFNLNFSYPYVKLLNFKKKVRIVLFIFTILKKNTNSSARIIISLLFKIKILRKAIIRLVSKK